MRRIFFSILLVANCITLGTYIGDCAREYIPWYKWVITSVAVVLSWFIAGYDSGGKR